MASTAAGMFFCWRLRMLRTEVITGFFTGAELCGRAASMAAGKTEAAMNTTAVRIVFIGSSPAWRVALFGLRSLWFPETGTMIHRFRPISHFDMGGGIASTRDGY